MDGSPVRILSYKIPKDPTKDRWVPEVIDESLHVVHNFVAHDVHPVGPRKNDKFGGWLEVASYEGVTFLFKGGDKWERTKTGEGNQANPSGNRGASEIKSGHIGRFGELGVGFTATIEPWHGNQVVVYVTTDPGGWVWRPRGRERVAALSCDSLKRRNARNLAQLRAFRSHGSNVTLEPEPIIQHIVLK